MPFLHPSDMVLPNAAFFTLVSVLISAAATAFSSSSGNLLFFPLLYPYDTVATLVFGSVIRGLFPIANRYTDDMQCRS